MVMLRRNLDGDSGAGASRVGQVNDLMEADWSVIDGLPSMTSLDAKTTIVLGIQDGDQSNQLMW